MSKLYDFDTTANYISIGKIQIYEMFSLKLKITLFVVYYLYTIEGKRIDVEVKNKLEKKKLCKREVKGTNGILKLIGQK